VFRELEKGGLFPFAPVLFSQDFYQGTSVSEKRGVPCEKQWPSQRTWSAKGGAFGFDQADLDLRTLFGLGPKKGGIDYKRRLT
jgi:hypothetical protein